MQSEYEQQTAIFKSFEKIMNAVPTSLSVAYLAKVVKYNKKKHIADLQPLTLSSGGEKSAQFLDVPVSENCYALDELIESIKPDFLNVDTNSTIGAHDGVPAHVNTHFGQKLWRWPPKPLMRVGVVVVAVVLDRDADNWDRSAKTFKPETRRKHDANDSIVIGVV